MRNRFDQQLALLNVELVTMGALCEEALVYATRALFQREEGMITRAEEAEAQIDQKEKDIENLCMKLLLQQQPVARDLREISAALKMISDLERIGDQAADIAELTRYVRLPEDQQSLHIAEMARAVIRMVTDSVDSFVKKDLDLARAVCAADDRVDELFDQVKSELIGMIAADAACGQQGLDLLMVAKYLERIGDHAMNVAQWAIFAETGTHHGVSLLNGADDFDDK